ncbi:hypothetical protein HDU98_008070 [Podochytrium sp. JEL0797]|nr:hypothetical protein HDU98_008070 [Podochytrium sp. JEL0797]
MSDSFAFVGLFVSSHPYSGLVVVLCASFAVVFLSPCAASTLLPFPSEKGLVLLSLPQRAAFPFASPFVAKLEAALRHGHVDFKQKDVAFSLLPRSKIPVVQWRDELVNDSHFIIKRLVKDAAMKDPDEWLDASTRAQAHFFRLAIENFIYYRLTYERWVHNWKDTKQEYFKNQMPWLIYQIVPDWLIQPKVASMLHANGTSRYTEPEWQSMEKEFWKQASEVLGSKKYFFSNQHMCSADFSAFGLLVNALEYPDLNPSLCATVKRFPNLVQFVEVVKKELYPESRIARKSMTNEIPASITRLTDPTSTSLILCALSQKTTTLHSSPFVIKLETALRSSHTQYTLQTVAHAQLPRRQMPVLHWEGEVLCDSQFILKRLVKEGVIPDPDAWMDGSTRAQAHMFRLGIENFMYYRLAQDRYIHHWAETKQELFHSMPWLVYQVVPDQFIQPSMVDLLHKNGTTRYTETEWEIMQDEFYAHASVILGEKKYFFGEIMCVADFSAFGHLVVALEFEGMNPGCGAGVRKHANLVRFVEVVKAELFPELVK